MTNAVNIASLGSAMTATSAGNVGINTTSPAYKLQVKGGDIASTSADGTVSTTLAYDGVYGQSASNLYLLAPAGYAIRFYANNTGSLTLGTTGNLTFTQSNAGIVFNNSSALTNSTLNDYETGTWTPVFNNFANTTGWTFFGATYTKIGRIVYISFGISPGSGTPLNASANSGNISGLPFNVSNCNSPSAWSTNYIDTLGTGVWYSNTCYSPTISVPNSRTIYVTGTYQCTF